MKTRTILLLSLIIISNALTSNKSYAADCPKGYFDIGPRLRDKFFTYEKEPDFLERLLSIDSVYKNSSAFTNISNDKYKEKFELKINPYLQREVHFQYLAVLNFKLQDVKTSEEQITLIEEMIKVIENAFMHYKLVIRELAEDPLIRTSKEKNIKKIEVKSKNWLAEFSEDALSKTKNCIRNNLNMNLKESKTLEGRTEILQECLKTLPVLGSGKFNLAKELGNKRDKINWWHEGDLLSPTGFIPGNSTELFYKTPSDLNSFYKMQKSFNIFKQDVVCNGVNMGPYVMTLENGKNQVLANVDFFKKIIENKCEPFTEEGFLPIEAHPTFASIFEERNGKWRGSEKSLFKKIRDGLDLVSIPSNEKTTLFVDIFFLGESIGAAIAKKIVQALESNQNLYVFIVRDLTNHYGHAKEMEPVFNYLRAISETRTDGRLVIAEAQLNAHPTGLPNWTNKLIPKDAQEKFGNNMDLSPMAKSDHSKVMIIDGANLEGKAIAYVSSKNWLDTSGGNNFDELISITGPAANIIQDNHVMDMVQALIRNGQRAYLDNLHRQLNLPDVETTNADPRFTAFIKAQQIVQKMGFHLFNREKAHQGKMFTESICAKTNGSDIVSVGENNFNSHIRTPLVQNLYLINHSTKPIYISNQLFAESNLQKAIVDAGKNRKIQSHLLLTYLPEISNMLPANFPSIFFIAEMLHPNKGAPDFINIFIKRAYSSDGDSTIRALHEEFHKKTITGGNDQWDIHISGSANTGFMTMRGAFRETQVMIFQPSAEEKTLAKESIEIFNDITKKTFNSSTDPLVKVTQKDFISDIKQQPDRDGAVKIDQEAIEIAVKKTPWIKKYMQTNGQNAMDALIDIKNKVTGIVFDPIKTKVSQPASSQKSP